MEAGVGNEVPAERISGEEDESEGAGELVEARGEGAGWDEVAGWGGVAGSEEVAGAGVEEQVTEPEVGAGTGAIAQALGAGAQVTVGVAIVEAE